MLHISQLYTYPVKSLAGVALSHAKVTERGLEHDRRWMLIDNTNRFLSQRELPQMALIKPALKETGIEVSSFSSSSSYIIPFAPQTNVLLDVTVWDDTCTAQLVSPEADAWFSDVLKVNCRLVYMPDATLRPVDPRYAPADKITSFADAYPFLLIGEESLTDLSDRVGYNIAIERFRPNLVISGGKPYLEDEMMCFTVSGIKFYGVKLCARCPIPNIDPETAISSKEPIKTLAGYRRMNNKTYLGQNLIHQGTGELNIGDKVEILESKATPQFV